LLCHRPLIAITGATNQHLIDVNPDLETVTNITSRLEHDLSGVLDLLTIGFLQQDPVVDQHARDNPRITQLDRRPPQHFRTTTLQLEIAKRALVRTGREVQWPAMRSLNSTFQHRLLDDLGAPLPKACVGSFVLLYDAARNEWMTINSPRQARDALSIGDCELQNFHTIAHI